MFLWQKSGNRNTYLSMRANMECAIVWKKSRNTGIDEIIATTRQRNKYSQKKPD